MRLSVVIVCWNGIELIGECLRSIFAGTRLTEFEVIVSDNGSTDGSVELVRNAYPQVRIVENKRNLGCAGGRNAGIQLSCGKYILLLDSDTVVREGSLDALVEFADAHPEAVGFGGRIVSPDGTPQPANHKFPTVRRDWAHALGLHRLARLVGLSRSGRKSGAQLVDWHSGSCVMFRGDVLKNFGGFDDQFFYTFDEVDLCRRLRDKGLTVLETSAAEVIHVGSRSVASDPERFELEKYRNRYRYYAKHFGQAILPRVRRAVLARLRIRRAAYGLAYLVSRSKHLEQRLAIYKAAVDWNRRLDLVRFMEAGEEPAFSSHVRRLPNADLLHGKK